jgi:hypothetical protein
MIKLLGFRRTLILGIMLAVNTVLATIYFLWASPETALLNTQLNGLRGEISTLQTNIQNTKKDLEMLQSNLGTYENYLAQGFFQEQDRFGMSRALEDIKTRAGIQGFSFSVGDIAEVRNMDALAAEKRLLHSRVSIDRVSAALDVNFFDMLSLIESEFPTHARIHSFELARAGSVTPESLKRLTEGPYSTINAKVVFDWLSLGQPLPPGSAVPGAPGRF